MNWDVDELKARKDEILSTDLLNIKLGGVFFIGWDELNKLGGLREKFPDVWFKGVVLK